MDVGGDFTWAEWKEEVAAKPTVPVLIDQLKEAWLRAEASRSEVSQYKLALKKAEEANVVLTKVYTDLLEQVTQETGKGNK